MEDFVTISAANDVADLLEAIIRKFPNTAGQEPNNLVVRPTRGGEPLMALRTKLSAVKFKCKADGSLHVYVDVPPRAAKAGSLFRLYNGISMTFRKVYQRTPPRHESRGR